MVRESARSLVCQDCRDSAKPCRNCFDAIVADGAGVDGNDDDEDVIVDDCEGGIGSDFDDGSC